MASWSGSQNPVPILEKIYKDLHDIKLYLMPSYNEREGVNEAFLDAAAESAARNGLPLSKAAASVSAPDGPPGAGAGQGPAKGSHWSEEAKAAAKAKREKKKVNDPDAPKKEVSERVRLWNILIAKTLEEMKAAGWTHPETGKPASRKDAMIAAAAKRADFVAAAAAEPESRKGGSRKQKSTRKRSRKSRKMYR
jgi:hypothetical protein